MTHPRGIDTTAVHDKSISRVITFNENGFDLGDIASNLFSNGILHAITLAFAPVWTTVLRTNNLLPGEAST